MNNNFKYIDNELYVENVPVKKISEDIGTPCYIYSYNELKSNYDDYATAFSEIDPIICYSTKANSNLAILKSFADLGSGFDIVSKGELFRVLKAGADASKTVFSGVGKTDDEIIEAIKANILFFNVESEEELNKINQIAISLNKKAPIAIRVNPDISPETHPYISTGFKKSKFGIEISKAIEVYKDASKMEGIEINAIDAHIGSQIFDLSSFSDSISKLVNLADNLKKEGINISYIDIGGGLGIKYKDEENPPDKKEYADIFKKHLEGTSYKLVLEPGRSLMGNAGIMTTKVLYLKEGTAKKFVIVDGAMNDLIRPAFYNSFHHISPVTRKNSEMETVDIVGPICESGDFLAQDREFPKVIPGDYLAVFSAGAYGFVMASNYNSRPRAAEVLVNDDKYYVIKERETYDDLFKGEIIPDFL
ncbi:MAG: diaminopimelate decarboxylase [Candidatus Dadabacteria bacterium]|nr:diaminopimelate decarboxylase [Candidatus Dadabacteria bacterium]NIQ14898.1 diaminopimelate decarboxylase [Candidatus Dadabacteria bacterium]